MSKCSKNLLTALMSYLEFRYYNFYDTFSVQKKLLYKKNYNYKIKN